MSFDIASLPNNIRLHPTPNPSDAQPKPSDPVRRPPPPHPPESVAVAPLPAATAAWQRAAARSFEACGQQPVEFPLRDGIESFPTPGDGKVFLASNYRPSSCLPPAHRAFLAKKTAEELVTRGVERVHDWSQVAAVLPMFVVEQTREDGTTKLRVIFDGRALNRLLAPARGSVSYDSVRDALTAGAFCTKLDIEAAFRNVPVGPESKRFLCYEVNGSLYRYRALPFGVSWSPALFIRALDPVMRRLRESGLRLVWYVDDVLVVEDTVERLDAAVTRVIDELMASGWLPSIDKTFPNAYSTITFLGLSVTFRNGHSSLSVPASKARKIEREAFSLACRKVAHVSQLQSLTGRLAFVSTVVPQVGFLRRGLDAAIGDALRSLHGCVPVIDRVKQELLAIAAAARDFTSFSYSTHDDADRPQLGTVYSDASAVGWGVLHVTPDAPMVRIPDALTSGPAPHGWTAGGTFSDAEKALPSGAREILAISGGIIALDLKRGDVAWHSDATVAVSAVSLWRTRSDAVAAALKDLWLTLRDRDLRVHISHVFRDAELMPVADFLSRRAWREKQAEWKFPPAHVATVLHSLRIAAPSAAPSIQFADLFASHRSTQFPKYCSRWAEPGSMGDAFHADWRRSSWCWWAFPPLSQLERFLLRLDSHADLSAATPRPPTSSSPPAQPLPPINVVLIYSPTSPTVTRIVKRLARRDVLISTPSRPSPSPLSPHRPRPLIPDLRLVRPDGEPAQGPPPWPLRAAWLHVS